MVTHQLIWLTQSSPSMVNPPMSYGFAMLRTTTLSCGIVCSGWEKVELAPMAMLVRVVKMVDPVGLVVTALVLPDHLAVPQKVVPVAPRRRTVCLEMVWMLVLAVPGESQPVAGIQLMAKMVKMVLSVSAVLRILQMAGFRMDFMSHQLVNLDLVVPMGVAVAVVDPGALCTAAVAAVAAVVVLLGRPDLVVVAALDLL